MTLIKKTFPAAQVESEELALSRDMLKSLCFNCDNRHHCTWKDERKINCEHFI